MDNRNHIVYYLALFLISPVLAVIAAMANFRNKNARVTMILFVAAFGYTLILTPGKDSYTHTINFLEFYQYIDFSQFISELQSVAAFKGSSTHSDEPFLIVVSYFLAQFTDDPSWLFFLVGLIYGYFFINGVSLVYSEVHRNWNIVLIILFVFFLSWKSFEGINSIRNWTAAWIYFNGAFLYLKTGNKKYILLVIAAPLFHFAYIVITLPFFAWYVLRDRRYFYISLLAVSYIFSVGVDILEPYMRMTELGETKLRQYSADPLELEEQGSRERSFHAQYYMRAGNWSLRIIFIYAILMLGYLKARNHDSFQSALGSLSILMLTFANLVTFSPVLQNRLSVNFGLFAFAYLIRLYSMREEPVPLNNGVVYLCIPAILLFIFTQYSQIGDFMDFRVLISPLSYPFLGEDPVSMKEFIRSLIF